MAENSSNLNYEARSSNSDIYLSVKATKDPLSTYFLSNGDGPGTILVTLKLVGNNFHSWSRSMRIALGSKCKIGFIDRSLITSRCNLMVIS